MSVKTLFTLPIPALPSHPGGSLTCTLPHPSIYLLTWTSPPDNRLTPAFLTTLLSALDLIEFRGAALGGPPAGTGVVATTSGIAKFYSNGLDLGLAVAGAAAFWPLLYGVFKRFLTYPLPTVALLNGHAFAGGLMLAMHHDYRVFGSATGRGYACVNELDFGAPLKPAMSAVFRRKTTARTYRSLVLEARRFSGPEALEAGIVDAVGTDGWAEVVRLVEDRGLAGKGKTGIYGVMKAEMYRECIGYLDGWEAEDERDAKGAEMEEARKADGERKAAELVQGLKIGAKL